jgi:hypothetical protein
VAVTVIHPTKGSGKGAAFFTNPIAEGEVWHRGISQKTFEYVLTNDIEGPIRTAHFEISIVRTKPPIHDLDDFHRSIFAP